MAGNEEEAEAVTSLLKFLELVLVPVAGGVLLAAV